MVMTFLLSFIVLFTIIVKLKVNYNEETTNKILTYQITIRVNFICAKDKNKRVILQIQTILQHFYKLLMCF